MLRGPALGRPVAKRDERHAEGDDDPGEKQRPLLGGSKPSALPQAKQCQAEVGDDSPTADQDEDESEDPFGDHNVEV